MAELVLPETPVEHDGESIGGEIEMTYPHIRPEYQARIKLVVVPGESTICRMIWQISKRIAKGYLNNLSHGCLTGLYNQQAGESFPGLCATHKSTFILWEWGFPSDGSSRS